jgi:hypothetical protein
MLMMMNINNHLHDLSLLCSTLFLSIYTTLKGFQYLYVIQYIVSIFQAWYKLET